MRVKENLSTLITGKVDESGNVSIIFNHASDYVIALGDKVMSENDVPADLRGEYSGQKVLEIGDSSNVVLYLIVMLAAAVFVVVAKIKTKFAKKCSERSAAK